MLAHLIQNHALNALMFLYKHVLIKHNVINIIRARRPKHLPVVSTREKVQIILTLLTETKRLMVSSLYESGLRLIEHHRLQVKDIGFSTEKITVRACKSFKDRVINIARVCDTAIEIEFKRYKIITP